MLGPEDREYLVRCACEAAQTAGAWVRKSRPGVVERKVGGESEASQVVTEVDRHSQDLILDVLEESAERFSLGVLSEELEDDGGRFERDYFWSVDPLDGTLPFIESRRGYAVSIALVSRAGVAEIGVVFDPENDTLYSARRGGGLIRNGRPWSPAKAGAGLTICADRSFEAMPNYGSVVAALDGLGLGAAPVQVVVGQGAVMNACHALERPPGCYFKFPKAETGGGALWDFAATACLYMEAGAVATDMEGEPLALNRSDGPWMNSSGVLFATDRDLAEQIMSVYRSASVRRRTRNV